jgi:thiol-disulfide isomerase/thioredoxin
MKILILTLGLLVLVSIGYLYVVETTQPIMGASTDSTIQSDVAGAQCVGTACTPTLETKLQMDALKTEDISKTPLEKNSEFALEKNTIIVTNEPTRVPALVPNSTYPRYTEFVNPSGYINSEPFLLSDVVGKKIIVIEFITYSCINCKRTFPFMKQWHEAYAKDGVLVIGIHTPEFSYERERENVVAAMQKEGITFPIVMDNDYASWNAYKNRFWPHRYVIDYNGNIVFDHIGEGAYAETEVVIQKLLQTKPVGV